MSTKIKILIDLDHVIFNTQYLRRCHLKFPGGEQNKKFLCPDTVKFLKANQNKFTFSLFSEGEIKFQKMKIAKVELEKLINWDEIILVKPGTKAELLPKLFEKGYTVLIDDRPDIIQKAAEVGFTSIRVKRGKYKRLATKCKAAIEVLVLSNPDLSTLLKQHAKIDS